MIFLMLIFIIVLICLCVTFYLKSTKTVEQNLKIIEENNRNEIIYNRLRQSVYELQSEEEKLKYIIENEQTCINSQFEKDKKYYEDKLNYLKKDIENAKNSIYDEFDTFKENIDKEREECVQELEKLKETRAAAQKALLKEQEVKENKDNYRLCLTQSDLSDVHRLEIVKRELNKPRILSMLIWQTFYQPLAKKQFPIILQDKTKCGIYKITNIMTDECYIGQSNDIYRRWNDHCKCGLGIDTPAGNKLYQSMIQYGLENFTFELLTECSQSELNEKEKYFIELYQANSFGFNGTGGNK